MTVAVITISDRASKGEYEDLSGPEIERILRSELQEAIIERCIVPDVQEDIEAAFTKYAGKSFIITTGGTGIGPRDVTPEITASYCDRMLPGIAEVLRAQSYRETPQAMLSRGAAGIKENTIIVNFPGSIKAVRLCTRVLVPVMEHAVDMIRGAGH